MPHENTANIDAMPALFSKKPFTTSDTLALLPAARPNHRSYRARIFAAIDSHSQYSP